MRSKGNVVEDEEKNPEMRIHLYSQQFKYRFLPIFSFASPSRSRYLYTVAILGSISFHLSAVLHDVWAMSVLKLFLAWVLSHVHLFRAIAKKGAQTPKTPFQLDNTYISFDYFACHKVLFLFAGAISILVHFCNNFTCGRLCLASSLAIVRFVSPAMMCPGVLMYFGWLNCWIDWSRVGCLVGSNEEWTNEKKIGIPPSRANERKR